MSTHQPTPTHHVSGNAYVVAPPRACDAVGNTLCRAFHITDGELDQFGDVMKRLDLIPSDPA